MKNKLSRKIWWLKIKIKRMNVWDKYITDKYSANNLANNLLVECHGSFILLELDCKYLSAQLASERVASWEKCFSILFVESCRHLLSSFFILFVGSWKCFRQRVRFFTSKWYSFLFSSTFWIYFFNLKLSVLTISDKIRTNLCC